MTKFGQFQTRNFGLVDVYLGHYVSEDGPLAVQLVSSETAEPIARLSVNMPGASEKLPRNCFYMKDWAENGEISIDAELSGLFRLRPDLPPAVSGWVAANAYEVVGFTG